MESQVQLQVVRVESRDATRKSDGARFKLYDIHLSDGEKYTTSRKDTAEQAHALTGQLALCTIKVEQNGIYTNRYLNGIQSLQGAIGAPQTINPAPVQVQGTITTTANNSPIADTTDVKEDRIMRQAAAKVSAGMSGTPAEFWANLDLLMDWFRLGKKPDWFSAGQPQPDPVPAADDDIPF